MQFHLNGFRPGNPLVAEASPLAQAHTEAAPAQVDVLIVGCGPAGLTLAAQLAAFPDIYTCIVEQKEGPMQLGQADGIACRTMEMFEAFDFADQVLKEACWINDVTFWKPDETVPGNIARHGRVQDTEDGLSEFPHVILNQARIHDFYLERMRNSPSKLEPHYARRVLDVKVDLDHSAADYPVTVTLERVDAEHAGQTEIVQARYVVGCDGARSNVRRAMGRQLVGDSANHAWGVMDILAVTDFPDIRYKAAIQSEHGNVLIIPREGGHLVRFYVEMDKLGVDERVASRHITVEQLIETAQRVIHPYKLEVKNVPWWSVYEIGQRICDKYDDLTDAVAAENSPLPHVFIAGDACHTHSPKAGQGMNFSMQDTFNLGWKLAAVLRKQCAPELLHTYSSERQVVAQQLIDFDREWAQMFSDRAKEGGEGGVDPKEFQKYFEQHGRFTAGVGTHYAPSVLTGEATHQALATGFTVGMRFHSAPVVRVSDAKPVHLGHCGKADGRWRLYAFAGQAESDLLALCRYLETDPASPLRRFTPAGQDMDSIFDVRAVFSQAYTDVALEKLPALLLPSKGQLGLLDYEKVFSPDLKNAGQDIYEMRGIDRQQGALVVVRPDQYVAQVLPLNDHAALSAYFEAFMLK